MTYKNIFFMVLLVPSVIDSYKNIDLRIQELQKKLSAKEVELSSISTKIAEKETLVNSLSSIAFEIYSSIHDNLNSEEKNEFEQEIYILQENLKETLKFEENIKELPIKQFISESTNLSSKREKFKIMLILHCVENFFLKKSYQLFAQCLQELSDIGCELIELQKKTLKN